MPTCPIIAGPVTYFACIGSSMPDPQHHGTLLICWTNYCAVLCLGVVAMCMHVVIN